MGWFSIQWQPWEDVESFWIPTHWGALLFKGTIAIAMVIDSSPSLALLGVMVKGMSMGMSWESSFERATLFSSLAPDLSLAVVKLDSSGVVWFSMAAREEGAYTARLEEPLNCHSQTSPFGLQCTTFEALGPAIAYIWNSLSLALVWGEALEVGPGARATNPNSDSKIDGNNAANVEASGNGDGTSSIGSGEMGEAVSLWEIEKLGRSESRIFVINWIEFNHTKGNFTYHWTGEARFSYLKYIPI